MKKLFKIIVFLFSIVSFLSASPCDNYQKDKAADFAEHFGENFVKGTGGGQDIRVNIEQCDYNTYSTQFRLKIDIKWDGYLFSSHHYEVDGILKLNDDGSSGSFAKTWVNQRFDDWQFYRKLVGGTIVGIIILNKMSEQNDNQ